MKIIGIQKIQSESFFNAEVTALNTLTVGVDGTGHDAKFFGDTSGQFLLWDQSSDELVLAGDTKLSFHDAAGGENIIASADGHLEINAGTTLDITATTIDINGAADISGEFTLAGTAIATVIAGTTVTNATNATTATNVTVADESTDTTCFPLFATAATGDLAPKSGTNLTFNSSSGRLVAGTFAGFVDGSEVKASDFVGTPTISDEDDEVCITLAGAKTRIARRRFNITTSADGNHEGDVVYFGSTTSMTAGSIYVYESTSWVLADADAASTATGMLAVALGTTSDNSGMLIRGMVTLSSDPGSVSEQLYLSTAGGKAQNSAPTGSGKVVRLIGYCLDSTNGQVYFNPDNHYTVL